jgi:hypothetical protein
MEGSKYHVEVLSFFVLLFFLLLQFAVLVQIRCFICFGRLIYLCTIFLPFSCIAAFLFFTAWWLI